MDKKLLGAWVRTRDSDGNVNAWSAVYEGDDPEECREFITEIDGCEIQYVAEAVAVDVVMGKPLPELA